MLLWQLHVGTVTCKRFWIQVIQVCQAGQPAVAASAVRLPVSVYLGFLASVTADVFIWEVTMPVHTKTLPQVQH